MLFGMAATGVLEGLRSVRAGLGALLSAPLSVLTSTEVTSLLAELEVERRRLDAIDQQIVAEMNERNIAGDYASAGTADLLSTLLRISPAEARARVERADDIGPRRSMEGTPLAPLLPAVADAMRSGEISAAHARVISDCIDHIPTHVAYEAAPVAERMLVEAARHEHPRALARTAALLLERIDPDGREPRDQEIERHREVRLMKRPDGSSVPLGLLTAETTAALEAIFDSLAAPVPADEGMPDERTPGQRRHDALYEAAQRLLRSDTLPASGGSPVTILATTTIKELASGIGGAVTGHGSTVSIDQLMRMACEAEVIPVVLNEAGGILAYGRRRRLASRGQRLALGGRDGGCSFPGCDRPAAWTEVHHVVSWSSGGRTDISNMCLLCRHHHREFERRGWVVQMRDGVPEWIPPPWLDPEQRPRRNTAHHLPDFEFEFASA
jgi:hypothetical protein